MEDPIFSLDSSVGAEAYRALIRFVSGHEDFARINKHYARRRLIPDMADLHCCVHCWRTYGKQFFDSEWHALFMCPEARSARMLFEAQCCGLDLALAGQAHPFDLARLVLRARADRALRDGLSRLVVDVINARRRGFRSLASRVLPADEN